MAGNSVQPIGSGDLWAIARRQHGAVARQQLLNCGYTRHAIDHRIDRGRLHPIFPQVFAVGRPTLTRRGRWMAAVLSCGDGSALSHHDAAALLGIRESRLGPIHVSIPLPRRLGERAGIVIHRRRGLGEWIDEHDGIPVTAPLLTLIDIAVDLSRRELEAAINEADALDRVHVDELRRALDRADARPGVAALRQLIDRRTFRLTDSELERRFLPIAREAGLPPPETQVHVNGWRVDFFWPGLGLVVETDSLRYHRTPAQQDRDRRRDQAHLAAGLTPLRFTHAQIRFERGYVRAVLERIAAVSR